MLFLLAILCRSTIIIIILPLCFSQNAQPRGDNLHFFPDDPNNTVACEVPPFQDSSNRFTPQDDMCNNNNNDIPMELSIQDNKALIQDLAVAYAPYLYFHPLEQFSMSSVNRTFRDPTQGEIYLDFADWQLIDNELNQSTLLRTTRDYDFALNSHLFSFAYHINDTYGYLDGESEEYRLGAAFDQSGNGDFRFGDGFDDEGISKAPIYYHVFDCGNGTVTFNYFFYYTWNGPANYGVLTSHNGTEQYTRMVLPPWEAHEGDWESMSVTVCNSYTPSQPLAITYRQKQGQFGQLYDCTKGECTFHKDSETNPVGFVALNTHDVYAFSAKDLIYGEAYPLEFWINLQGVLSVHRTEYRDSNGNTRSYKPTHSNVLRLAKNIDIPDNVDRSEYWGAFGGRWYVTREGVCSIFPLVNFLQEIFSPMFLGSPGVVEMVINLNTVIRSVWTILQVNLRLVPATRRILCFTLCCSCSECWSQLAR